MNRWALRFSIAGSLLVAATGFAQDDPPNEASKIFDQSLLLKKVTEVVKKHYPKAKVELKDGSIRFDYETRIFKIHSPTMNGIWQDAHDERGPQPGGIFGWIELADGRYGSMAGLPQEFNCHYYKSYRMGHYARKLNCTVDAEVSYPPREGEKFRDEFEKVVNEFEKYVRRKAK